MVEIEEIKSNLIQSIVKLEPKILNELPIDKYISLLDQYPNFQRHNYTSKRINNLTQQILNNSPESVLDIYHRLLIVELIEKPNEKREIIELSQEAAKDYEDAVSRILTEISKAAKKTSRYLYSNQSFYYDLGTVKHSIIPLGAFKLNINSFNTASFFIKTVQRNGLSWATSDGLVFLRSLKFYRPYFELHLDLFERNSLKHFSEKGWIELYLKVADLLKLNKNIRGLQTVGWFFDPQLLDVSPELGYIQKLVGKLGGTTCNAGQSESGIKNATFMNKHRTKLFKEGKYKPMNYFVIISRDKLINWAENYRATEHLTNIN